MRRIVDNEEILRAALAVFAKQGYDGATTRELAKAADVNEVTLFRRFGSKQKLLLAAVEQEVSNFGADGVVYTGDLVADLSQIVVFYQQVLAERRGVVMLLLTELPRHPDLIDVLQVAMVNARKLAEIIGRYQSDGKLTGKSPLPTLLELISPIFTSQLLGITALGLTPGEPNQVVQQFLHGHCPSVQTPT